MTRHRFDNQRLLSGFFDTSGRRERVRRQAGRSRLSLELLEGRRLLAAEVTGMSGLVDSLNGLCHPAASVDLQIDSSATDNLRAEGGATAVPEGVGVALLEPEELVQLNREYWESFKQPEYTSQGGGGSQGPELVSTADTFRLHSRPGATKTLYLDFDGHVATGTTWNDFYRVATITSPAYDPAGDGPAFNDEELRIIQTIWHRVAEDFSPFDINVTTEEPPESDLVNTGGGDDRWGLRVVQTIDNFAACGCGGFAFINSFNWDYNSAGATDTPAYSFNVFPPIAAQTISHEAGHALGLSHDGDQTQEYYPGHGVGETGWGPIMGAPFFSNVVHWSQGEYAGANNGGAGANYGRGRDDLGIITSFNGFGYREDEAGSTLDTAVEINYDSVNAANPDLVDVSLFGVIETPTDLDAIKFVTGSGTINLTIESYAGRAYVSDGAGGFSSVIENTNYSTNWSINQGSNLDVAASLYDGGGNLIAFSNPTGLSAEFTDLSVSAGVYYLVLEGVGFGDPMNASSPDGYTDYGSLGQYYVSGTLVNVGGPVATAFVEDIEFTETDDVVVTVSYADRDGVDVSTLGTGDIIVTGPEGYSEIANFVEVDDPTNGERRVATYTIPAPNGAWDDAANGTYTISLRADEVADLVGEFGEPGPIGTFNVNVAPVLGPDGFGHIAYPIRYEFQDISDSGTMILKGADEASRLVSPGNGFSFNFYGTDYESVYVSSNGLLTFGTANSEYENTDLTEGPLPPSIAVLWDDLFALPNEGVYWQLVGSGDQQQLIVQWETGYFGGNGRISFQAILSEEGNTIQVNYRDLLGGHGKRDNGISATVGIKDLGPQGDHVLLVQFNQNTNGYLGSGKSFVMEIGNRPMIDLQLSAYSVNENLAAGSLVGFLAAVDPDPNDSFTYELVAGAGDFDNGNFEIVGNELRTLAVFDYEQQAAQLIRVRTTDSGGNQLEKEFVVDVVDLPELEGIVVGDGTDQRSRVDQVDVTFEGPVDVLDDAFMVMQRGSGETVPVTVTTALDGQGRTVATLTFDGSITRAGGALVDGNYQLTIDGTKILRGGQTLDADQDGSGGDVVDFGNDQADHFFAMYGDVDGNRAVNLTDFGAFRSVFGKSSDDEDFDRSLDFDDSGAINIADFGQFRARFGTTLGF